MGDLSDLEFQQKKKLFRFKEMWLADKGFGEIIEGLWQASYDGAKKTKVIWKLENYGKELTRWSRNCFGNIQRKLERKRKELTWVGRLALQGGGSFRVVQLQKEINLLMDKEVRMWRQRSRTLYIKDGNLNTCFFHCQAIQRK